MPPFAIFLRWHIVRSDEDYNARTHEVENQNASIPPAREREMYFLLTCFYVILEVAREQAKLNTEEEKSLKGRLGKWNPKFIILTSANTEDSQPST